MIIHIENKNIHVQAKTISNGYMVIILSSNNKVSEKWSTGISNSDNIVKSIEDVTTRIAEYLSTKYKTIYNSGKYEYTFNNQQIELVNA